MNSVLIVGNIVRDAEIKSIGNGKTVARFTVACNRNYIDANGEKKQLADFVSVVAWGNLADKRQFVQGRSGDGAWPLFYEELADTERRKTLYDRSYSGRNRKNAVSAF